MDSTNNSNSNDVHESLLHQQSANQECSNDLPSPPPNLIVGTNLHHDIHFGDHDSYSLYINIRIYIYDDITPDYIIYDETASFPYTYQDVSHLYDKEGNYTYTTATPTSTKAT